MKQDRERLNERIRLLISKLQERRPFYDYLKETYNIPISLSADICAIRKDISGESDFVAFALLDGLTYTTNTSQKELGKFFTDDEINTFKNQRLATEKFELPLIFNNMVQVAQDQWIGKITAKELMRLKDAQIIKYNENTQRTMKRVVHGENRYYKIMLNNKSVNEIKDSFENGAYISDDITLNMPESTEFEYNNGKIVIAELDKLDILDGYHRYIAISRISMENPNFDYPMELRLVNFSEEKAKQLIYQKDQKTKMRQVDSNSMNQYNPANIIVDQLNSDPSSNVQGMIKRNGGQINYTELAAMVDYYWFREMKKKPSRKDILTIKKELQDKFNIYISSNLSLADHIFNTKELHIIIYCFKYRNDYVKSINNLIGMIDSIPSDLFNITNGKVRRKLVNEFEKRLIN